VKGGRGPSDGYVSNISLTFTPGDYAVSGTATVTNASGAPFEAFCQLVPVEGATTRSSASVEDIPSAAEVTVPVVGSATVSSGTGTVGVDCGTLPTGVTVLPTLTAVQVATLHGP
jgi:hypothetical protein